MDRNTFINYTIDNESRSLSARRAWIEIVLLKSDYPIQGVALRKESVDRNSVTVDRLIDVCKVALRKESVDRNAEKMKVGGIDVSLSARRAWIEIKIISSSVVTA